MSEPKEKEKNTAKLKYLLTRIILPVFIIIFLIIIQLRVTFQNNKLLKQMAEKYNNMEEINNIYEEDKNQLSMEDALELLLKRISGIQEENIAVRRAVNNLNAGKREEQIITMLSEKFINDYTDKGLRHFFESDYKNAENAFNTALLYQNDNTSLMFFRTYCSYLNMSNDNYSDDETYVILLHILELKEKGFKEAETIYFSISEMEKIVNEMYFNINFINSERVSNERE